MFFARASAAPRRRERSSEFGLADAGENVAIGVAENSTVLRLGVESARVLAGTDAGSVESVGLVVGDGAVADAESAAADCGASPRKARRIASK